MNVTEQRRQNKQKLLAMAEGSAPICTSKLAARFSLNTGLRCETIVVMIKELCDAGMLQIVDGQVMLAGDK